MTAMLFGSKDQQFGHGIVPNKISSSHISEEKIFGCSEIDAGAPEQRRPLHQAEFAASPLILSNPFNYG